MEAAPEVPWHHVSADEVASSLSSNPDRGLSREEAAARLRTHGPNTLASRPSKSWALRLLGQFHQPLIYVLIVAAGVTAVLGEWADSIVIALVVAINAAVGYLQESRAVHALEALARTMTGEATVVRDGERQRIPLAEVVPGDLVLLETGDKVPADIRLLAVRELRIDESVLTGESVPVEKGATPVERDAVLSDRRSMAFASSLVAHGHGLGFAVATGQKTEVGRISGLLSAAESLETPLTLKIAAFSGKLLYWILALAAATFFVGLLRGEPIIEVFMGAVALAVGAIPEGLPAAVTIILAIGVARMARRNAVIRRLPAVETLGSTTVICTDKTGTLTQNEMTVLEVVTAQGHYDVSGGGYDPSGSFDAREGASPESSDALRETLLAGLLCNDARLVQTHDGWTILGDPTEGALVVSAHKLGLRGASVEPSLRRLDELPFESERRYMATLHEGLNGTPVAYVKGAVEVILPRCTQARGDDGRSTALDRERIRKATERMAGHGLRVLAMARRALPAGTTELAHADVEHGLEFLGLQAMKDPPRPEAIDAVGACQRAGIEVKMITGDHVLTATSIAAEIGIVKNPGAQNSAVTGRELEAYSDSALVEVVRRTAVFARVSPEQKLRLVSALQRCGEVVAMTGDGVNDAPALKQANIGVAMGRMGTEVAKEASDMVLTDDNFATIRAAVEEGRGVFDNLIKFIVWTLPTNIAEGSVLLVAIIAGMTLPILPVQILWINMSTSVLLWLALAFEPKEHDLMDRAPRRPEAPLLGRILLVRMLLVGLSMLLGAFGLFELALWQGLDDAQARTITLNVIVATEAFYLLNCRSLTRSMFALGVTSNIWVILGGALMLGLQVMLTYAPFANEIFRTQPIPIEWWIPIHLVAIAVYVVVGVEKWINKRRLTLRAAARPAV